MSAQTVKPVKIGTEITVRISLAFQEAPDVHTLLAMTPVRERGKLVRLALERYIAETAHPAGNVEQQISAISQWLRSRGKPSDSHDAPGALTACSAPQHVPSSVHADKTIPPYGSAALAERDGHSVETSLSINRWLQT